MYKTLGTTCLKSIRNCISFQNIYSRNIFNDVSLLVTHSLGLTFTEYFPTPSRSENNRITSYNCCYLDRFSSHRDHVCCGQIFHQSVTNRGRRTKVNSTQQCGKKIIFTLLNKKDFTKIVYLLVEKTSSKYTFLGECLIHSVDSCIDNFPWLSYVSTLLLCTANYDLIFY